ncbi:hypothetical protein NDU88_004652 [Pleurodeles waltl]|uniref:Uncharacterized protein n=1 Tax=Pleurodeles waltl TaxID=8319 RepID=A0AAV7UHM7_PLEWA|nr:hypothetical protein NDU88_004652 [Pleurodeles waltl]
MPICVRFRILEGGELNSDVPGLTNSLRITSASLQISSARRGVRSGPPSNWEREELEPLRNEPLSLMSASLLVSDSDHANVLMSLTVFTWSAAICDFVGRAVNDYLQELLPTRRRSSSAPARSTGQGNTASRAQLGCGGERPPPIQCTDEAAARLSIPSGSPGWGAHGRQAQLHPQPRREQGRPGSREAAPGNREHLQPLRPAWPKPPRHMRVQAGRRSNRLPPRGLRAGRTLTEGPARPSPAAGTGPARDPGGSRPAGNQRSPPSWGPRLRPLQRRHQSHQSCVVLLVSPID